jgi:hypothetical protein
MWNSGKAGKGSAVRSADRVRAELRGFRAGVFALFAGDDAIGFSCVPEFQIQTSLWKEWEIATSCPSRYLKSIAEIQRQKNQRSGGVGGRISVFGHGLFRPGRAAACGAPAAAALIPRHVAGDGPTSNKN